MALLLLLPLLPLLSSLHPLHLLHLLPSLPLAGTRKENPRARPMRRRKKQRSKSPASQAQEQHRHCLRGRPPAPIETLPSSRADIYRPLNALMAHRLATTDTHSTAIYADLPLTHIDQLGFISFRMIEAPPPPLDGTWR